MALQLEVVPLINSEKEVSLDILQKIDSVAGSTVIDGNAIPNISTRYIRTTVAAPNELPPPPWFSTNTVPSTAFI